MTKFKAKIEPVKGGGHYVLVPDDVAARAKLAYRARVRGTVDGVAYRSSPLPGDTLPAELVAAFRKDARARAAWEKLAPSHRREHVKAIDEAKKPETRKTRIERTLKMLIQ